MSLWPPSVFHPTLSFPQPCAPKRFALIAQGKDGKLRKCTQSACGSQHLPLELEGTPQVDTPQWALSWRTQNHPNRSPVQASQYPTTPRRPRLQENGGSALGTTWKPGAASLPRSLGEVGLLSGRCVSRNLCSPAKPIAAAGLPWRLQLLPPQPWRQFWARGAFGSGRRAPGEQVPGSPPQVNAQAGSPG